MRKRDEGVIIKGVGRFDFYAGYLGLMCSFREKTL